jgi:HlyD family secretion protein
MVDLIAPEANRQKATVQVRVKILKPDELLRPDMNASVAFRSKEPPKQAAAGPALVVPAAAVKDGAVFVVVGDVAQKRAVQTGVSTSRGLTVISGLSAGDEIIASPPEGLADGARIHRQEKQP